MLNNFLIFFSSQCTAMWLSIEHLSSTSVPTDIEQGCSGVLGKRLPEFNTLSQTRVSQSQWEVTKNLILSWFYWLHFYWYIIELYKLPSWRDSSLHLSILSCVIVSKGRAVLVNCSVSDVVSEDWLTHAEYKLLLNQSSWRTRKQAKLLKNASY